MRCDQARDHYLPLAVGADLTELESRELAAHLAECPDCRAAQTGWHGVRLATLARVRPSLPADFWAGFAEGVAARIESDMTDRAFAPTRPALPAGFWDGWSAQLADRVRRERVRSAPISRWRIARAWVGMAAAAALAAVLALPVALGPPAADVEGMAEAPVSPTLPTHPTLEAPWRVRRVRGFALDNSVRVQRAKGDPGGSSALDVVRPLDTGTAPDFPMERTQVPTGLGERASF